jgi:hypothetical protein
MKDRNQCCAEAQASLDRARQRALDCCSNALAWTIHRAPQEGPNNEAAWWWNRAVELWGKVTGLQRFLDQVPKIPFDQDVETALMKALQEGLPGEHNQEVAEFAQALLAVAGRADRATPRTPSSLDARAKWLSSQTTVEGPVRWRYTVEAWGSKCPTLTLLLCCGRIVLEIQDSQSGQHVGLMSLTGDPVNGETWEPATAVDPQIIAEVEANWAPFLQRMDPHEPTKIVPQQPSRQPVKVVQHGQARPDVPVVTTPTLESQDLTRLWARSA